MPKTAPKAAPPSLADRIADLYRSAAAWRERIREAIEQRALRHQLRAEAVQALGGLLTDDLIRALILPLVNQPGGVRVDRDPDMHQEPYPLAVYRRVWIAAELAGLSIENGEVMILDGQCYETKAAVQRRLRERLGRSGATAAAGDYAIDGVFARVPVTVTYQRDGEWLTEESVQTVRLRDDLNSAAIRGLAETSGLRALQRSLERDTELEELRWREEAGLAHAAAEGSQDPLDSTPRVRTSNKSRTRRRRAAARP